MALIKNLADYLLGIDAEPDYVLDADRTNVTTERIAEWWFERWAKSGYKEGKHTEQIAANTLVYPIRHSARVDCRRASKNSCCSRRMTNDLWACGCQSLMPWSQATVTALPCENDAVCVPWPSVMNSHSPRNSPSVFSASFSLRSARILIVARMGTATKRRGAPDDPPEDNADQDCDRVQLQAFAVRDRADDVVLERGDDQVAPGRKQDSADAVESGERGHRQEPIITVAPR